MTNTRPTESLQILLPMRPAALPDAQRLAAWARRSGMDVRVELVATLPDCSSMAVAIGEFANASGWMKTSLRTRLPAGDWAALRDWANAHLPVCEVPLSLFNDSGTAPEVLPGEYWVEAGTPGAMSLHMAPPEWSLLQHARARDTRLALAESCTGGDLAARITALPGSSALLRHGFVTYSNAAKIQLLKVQEATLARVGAVAEETALEMLAGALHDADIAAAVTGIAGPGGAVPGKPVGTVCIAWGARGAEPQVSTCHFHGDRWSVQYAAGSVALGGLLGLLRGAG
ncbi:CinA family protein [Acidithiobacillus sp.]|jgi:nicotinamide-nucleotide amidase|uniref:CinA family protein n=1 Tax=Acidithiobacillus sp. TaxID=1872118 RepID=UPI0025BA3196|nr:CinA family protein [Acidithiobacillus sp.]MCK9188415.1 CinA family protein [Acidithiobacillus sp.]MCK9358836.1 CinA family protein [Acidithiobacillus sp.]